MKTFTVEWCQCGDIMTTLISQGLFPTSPHQPCVAISVDLLELFHVLFQRACEATTALAAATKVFYLFQGYIHCNSKVGRFFAVRTLFITRKQGEVVQDPFRRGIGHAIQWYDSLRRLLLKKVDDALFLAESIPVTASTDRREGSRAPLPHAAMDQPSVVPSSSSSPLSEPATASTDRCEGSRAPLPHTAMDQPSVAPSSSSSPLLECVWILQRQCPCCFSGVKFGHALEK